MPLLENESVNLYLTIVGGGLRGKILLGIACSRLKSGQWVQKHGKTQKKLVDAFFQPATGQNP